MNKNSWKIDAAAPFFSTGLKRAGGNPGVGHGKCWRSQWLIDKVDFRYSLSLALSLLPHPTEEESVQSDGHFSIRIPDGNAAAAAHLTQFASGRFIVVHSPASATAGITLYCQMAGLKYLEFYEFVYLKWLLGFFIEVMGPIFSIFLQIMISKVEVGWLKFYLIVLIYLI